MEQDNILSTKLLKEDSQENILRPSHFNQFQGKQEIKDNLTLFIQATLKREKALDHVFISGPPGLGKTTLAVIIASELNTELKLTSAPALEKAKDLVGILTTLEENSVFFIDEIHRLKPIIEETLYIAMEDFCIDWIIGQGPGARSVRIPLKPFTLIGATTKAGSVASPLYSRFGINIKLDLYEPSELESIIKRNCDILSVKITEQAIKKLSHCCRGTPRIVNRLIKRMSDFALMLNNNIIDEYIIKEGLNRLQIDELGLEAQDIKLLKIIAEKYEGGPVGGNTLAISIGESIETLEDFHEPYLIQLGFLKRTPRGRMVTELAIKYLKI